MVTFAGYMQTGIPAAGDARLCASGPVASRLAWQATSAPAAATAAGRLGMNDAMKAIPTFVDVPATSDHRHRRPWGTS
jgi:hypothetical protein